MGDSIAAGVGQFRPECEIVAKVGITSGRYVTTLLTAHDAKTIVISLGVNDGDRADTVNNLQRVRAKVQGETVYWLLPAIKDRARAAIRAVARKYGDKLIDTRPCEGPDHLHPTTTGYRVLASMTRERGESPTMLSCEPSALSPRLYSVTAATGPRPLASPFRSPGPPAASPLPLPAPGGHMAPIPPQRAPSLPATAVAAPCLNKIAAACIRGIKPASNSFKGFYGAPPRGS